jgi:hypothetical protein
LTPEPAGRHHPRKTRPEWTQARKPTKQQGVGNLPTLRYARHRGRVKADYQHTLAEKVATCWQAITSGHVFSSLSREDSDARCRVLDEMATGLMSNGTALDDWFNDVTRPKFFH